MGHVLGISMGVRIEQGGTADSQFSVWVHVSQGTVEPGMLVHTCNGSAST